MEAYHGKDIRNISLVGHSGCGKTSLIEAILQLNGYIDSKGSIDMGNTVSDFTKEEIERRISINSTLIPIEKDGIKFNFIDTPGAFDFSGEVNGSFAACESALLLIDASSGIEVGTEKVWRQINKTVKPTMIFINKMEKEDVDVKKLLDELYDFIGDELVVFNLPIGSGNTFQGVHNIIDVEDVYLDELKEYREDFYEKIKEKVAETDEVLLEKYFNDEAFTTKELDDGVRKSIRNRDMIPIVFGSVEEDIGIEELESFMKKYLPSPMDLEEVNCILDDEEVIIKVKDEEQFSAIVFKTIIDPFVGKLSMFKVLTGQAVKDMPIYNSSIDESAKMGQLLILRGEISEKVDVLRAGDIGLTAKLSTTKTGDTLSTDEKQIRYEKIDYPQPIYYRAIQAREKADEDKIGISLNRLAEEDATLVIERNVETKQLLIGGQGNIQLEVVLDKLKNTFDVEVDVLDPKVAYRETIRASSQVQGRHKKQSGGAGQYGDVHIRLEPYEEEFLFEEEVFGGSVPRNFFPAVEKGIIESLEEGVLGGFPVVNVKATLFDGSYHPVDSNDMAFKIAASMAFKEGVKKAQPVLLEPIMKVNVLIPEIYMGDVMGDMSKRRGKIQGMEPRENGEILIIAEAPQSELFKYAIDLRSMTQARGEFSLEFLRYDEVPKEIQDEILSLVLEEV